MFTRQSKFFLTVFLFLFASSWSTGCNMRNESPKGTSSANTPAQPSQPSPSGPTSPATAAPAASLPAIAEADGETPGTKIQVQELKRGSNSLMLKFAILNDSEKAMGFGYNFGDKSNEIKDFATIGGVTLVDSAGKKKYFVVRDTENTCVCSSNLKDIAPHSRVNLWAKFPSPPDDVQKISVVVPHFTPMDDVPISK